MRLIILIALLASSCRCERTQQKRSLLAEECVCPCACPVAVDAQPAPDAPPDAAPSALDLIAPWTRTVITPSSPTRKGADGVSRDIDGCWVTPWEQSNRVTRACLVEDSWVTTEVATVSAPEDAKSDDLDADGQLDVVIAAGQRVYVAFGGTTTAVAIPASAGHGNVMQVAIADVNADAHLDIVFGTTHTSLGVVSWLENPGPAQARTAESWAYHQISAAGWVMSLVPRDVNNDTRMDVVISDRAKVGTTDWSHYGARWSEQMSDGTWMNHTIAGGAATNPATPYQTGNCNPHPYASPLCQRTPGDEMMLSVHGDAVYDCTSASSQVDSRILIHRTADWLTWTHELVPAVANVGHCQHVMPFDPDDDGDLDIAVTTWKGGSYPVAEPAASRSGVYWLRNNGDGTYSRGEVSGAVGGKFDGVAALGVCLVTTEQLDPQNGIGVAMYCPSGAP